MIIAYLSLVIVVGSLIYLAFVAFKIFKDTKLVLDDLSKMADRLQGKMELLKKESTNLTETQQDIAKDVAYKKQAVQYTVDSVKGTPDLFKEIWNAINRRERVYSKL